MAFIEPFPYYPARITSINDESEYTKTFQLRVDVPWLYKAGQRCVVRITDTDGHISGRDYSLSSAPSSDLLELCVERTPYGKVSNLLHASNVNDPLVISLPLGEAFSWDPADTAPIILVAGGIGISPLMGIVREHRLSHSHTPLHLFYSAQSDEHVCFYDELRAPEANQVIDLYVTRTSTQLDVHERRMKVEEIVSSFTDDSTIYLCGSSQFVRELTKELHSASIPLSSIKAELFG